MTQIRVQGGVSRPERKVHILVYSDEENGPRTFCKPDYVYSWDRSTDGHTGPESDFCARCLRRYRAWRLRYGYGEIETVEE